MPDRETAAAVMVAGAGRLPGALATERRVEEALVRFFERNAHMRVIRMVPLVNCGLSFCGCDPFVEFSDDGGEGDISLADLAKHLVLELNL